MSSGEWWTDSDGAAGDFNPNQTAAAQNQFDTGTTYAGPGQQAPIDQYNFTPDPNLPGGFAVTEPGSEAPLDQAQFSNLGGNYPDQDSMAQSLAAQAAQNLGTTIDSAGNAITAMPDPYQITAQPEQYASQSSVYTNPAANGPQVAPGGSIGYVNWGQTPVAITPTNTAVLGNRQLQQQIAPGYIPGSGSYNQYNLGQGNLFGGIGPNNVMSNLNFGVGGPGDPTHGAQAGLEQQTPDQWVQGDHLFDSMVGNIGTRHNNGTEGLDYIPTLFARGDTPSGISTVAFGAPQQYWDGLYQAIGRGIIKPTARGWQLLASRGVTPQTIGGQAPGFAQSVGYGGAGGTGGASGQTAAGAPGAPRVASATGQTGPMGAGTEAWNYNRALIDLQTAGLAQNSQQFQDQLAFNRAVQQFREEMGRQQTSLGYLGLTSQLRGPGDLFQYLKVLGGTPGGIKDVVNAAAGKYNMPRTGGGQVTVGGYSNPSDINDLLTQMNDPNYGAEAQNLNLPPPNQISAANLARMTPAQQKVLLAAYEAAGYNVEDVARIFQNSLPQYAAAGGVGRVNLFS